MKFTSTKEIESFLSKLVPSNKVYEDEGLSLKRMWSMLDKAGNPHEKLRTIHIAGTSGKTSTAYYIREILEVSGKKTGLTISPHLVDIKERFQIGGEAISEEVFCETFSEFITLISGSESIHRYFEVLIVYALWLFVKENVDYAVLETGLGGLHDGTNVVTREDKLCVLTDIGLDHENILGSNVSDIAAKKAGIIHEQNHVITYQQQEEVMLPIKARIDEKNAVLNTLSFNSEVKKLSESANTLPIFQKRNWIISGAACKYLAKRDKFQISTDIDPLSIVVPGRMEPIIYQEKTVILDGAHNAQKMQSFVNSFVDQNPDKKVPILLALKQGKDYKKVIDIVSSIASEIVITTFKTSQDLPLKSQDPNIVAGYAKERGLIIKTIKDNIKAFSELLSTQGDLKIVTGSLYLVGQIKQTLSS